MNGVEAILRAFGRVGDKIISVFGRWGSQQPIDDSKSGIKIGDKTYNTVVSLNGCYYYIDEDGKKQPIADLPKGSYEWVNIAEKVLKDFRTCYRTLGGKVEVWSWYLLNDEMETLKEQHRITDSTDIDYPVGTLLEEGIPEEWRMIDCDLPDMTERDITMINRCYKTPGGKVEIEGLEAIDDKIQIRESIYVIIQSTDEEWPANREFNTIPSDWVRVVCDFPDMTERDVTFISECYTTPGGKVQVEGLEAIDNILGLRESTYTVIQSTDGNFPAGFVTETIPDDWIRMVCDFPDMTDRHIVEINECYNTGGGKVEVKGYQAVDSILGVREQYYFVVNTTDPAYAQWTRLDKIPNTWSKTACDFPDLTERHVINVDECYQTEGGKVKLKGYRSVDGVLGVRASYLIVVQSTDPDIPRGETMTSVPGGWNQVVCDFPDPETADTEIVYNCYSTGDGKVKVRSYLTFDGEGNTRGVRNIIMQSTDPAYSVGAEIGEIPGVWLNAECDFASLSERHPIPVDRCFNTGAGSVHIKGFKLVDNLMNEDGAEYIVSESSDAAYPIGMELSSIPDGWTAEVCKFADGTTADTEVVYDCVSTGNGILSIRSYVLYDGDGKQRSRRMEIVSSSDPEYQVGQAIDDIEFSWTPVDCNSYLRPERHVLNVSYCYEKDRNKLFVEGYRIVDGKFNNIGMELVVLESSDPNIQVGSVLTAEPDGYMRIVCECNCGR